MFRELMAGRGSRANASTSGNFALWGNFLPPAGMGYARHLPLLAFLACLSAFCLWIMPIGSSLWLDELVTFWSVQGDRVCHRTSAVLAGSEHGLYGSDCCNHPRRGYERDCFAVAVSFRSRAYSVAAVSFGRVFY